MWGSRRVGRVANDDVHACGSTVVVAVACARGHRTCESRTCESLTCESRACGQHRAAFDEWEGVVGRREASGEGLWEDVRPDVMLADGLLAGTHDVGRRKHQGGNEGHA